MQIAGPRTVGTVVVTMAVKGDRRLQMQPEVAWVPVRVGEAEAGVSNYCPVGTWPASTCKACMTAVHALCAVLWKISLSLWPRQQRESSIAGIGNGEIHPSHALQLCHHKYLQMRSARLDVACWASRRPTPFHFACLCSHDHDCQTSTACA